MKQSTYQDALFTLLCISANQVLELDDNATDFVKLVHPSYQESDKTSPVYKATADAIAKARKWARLQKKSTEKKRKKLLGTVEAIDAHVYHWCAEECTLDKEKPKDKHSPTVQKVRKAFEKWCNKKNIRLKDASNVWKIEKPSFERILKLSGFEIEKMERQKRRVHYLQWKTTPLQSSPSSERTSER